jgi:hypothetical protein
VKNGQFFALQTAVTLFALQTVGENRSDYLLYKWQVKIGHIICFTYSRGKMVTLFALHTAGEKLLHYWLYKEQVKIGHFICFTYSRYKLATYKANYVTV